MAPVPLLPEIRYDAVALVGGHFAAAILLTVEVGRSLYRSYSALGPAQDTRVQLTRRSTLLPIFATLAGVSLACAAYSAQSYLVLSYKTWADQRDIKIPTRFYGDQGILPWGAANATQVYLAQWASEAPIHLDAIEIAAELARRFWWGQQVELGLVAWSLFLSFEGRRRNIPLLWCYLSLGQLVSLSFAQNLFFIALILTPTPLPRGDDDSLPVSRYVRLRNRMFPQKPANWIPHPLLYVLILTLDFAAVSLTPLFANTPSLKYLIIGSRGLVYLPLVLHYVVPAGWGIQHTHPHEAYGTYTKLFKFVSLISFLLHAKATVVGLAYNAPAAHHHRHSVFLPFDVEKRTSWERATSSFGRILAATSDHPVISGIGWDVIISAFSLGLWASVRAIDVWGILASTLPVFEAHPNDEDYSAGKPSRQSHGSKRSKGKALKASDRDGDTSEPSSPRKRGRSRKDRDEDGSYEPTAEVAASVAEGDPLPRTEDLVDWESTAVVWGLTALGGLGVGSAGVLGGECVAR